MTTESSDGYSWGQQELQDIVEACFGQFEGRSRTLRPSKDFACADTPPSPSRLVHLLTQAFGQIERLAK